VGFHILADNTNGIKLHFTTNSVSDTYTRHIPTTVGTTTIAWCKQTLFFRSRRGHTNIPYIRMTPPTTDTELHVYTLDHKDQYTRHPSLGITPHTLPPMTGKDMLPHIPEVILSMTTVPPLWALCKLALGTPGIAKGGFGDPADLAQRLLPPLWINHHVVMGHKITPRAASCS
jgi:hypothetical protein